MSTTIRSFTVFKDDILSSPSKVDASEENDALLPTFIAPPPPGPLLVYCPDKENINPATGLRANAEHTSTKKRKTGVLATKLHIPPPSKKQKELKEQKVAKAPKKIRRTPLSTSPSKARTTSDKPKRTHTSRRSGGAGPKVQKVQEHERISQAVVDSRCYELTVLPLADVSQAYDETPAFGDHLAAAIVEDFKIVPKELSEPPAETDRPSSPLPLPSNDVLSSSPGDDLVDPTALSTPQRKRIYSSFTFSSPSPSGNRYAATRGSGVDRFSDIIL
ncbi:hypothetical protein A0H81_12463 [Grifola frondosa]|uniref:Uncharacterized protein n=1 Tax=Grifola frondosa TaxID=5627 RepID=A0A1C7LV62_GRIFR|nr:hypothetical protein A0H81_12463 [Grifola frondosa]